MLSRVRNGNGGRRNFRPPNPVRVLSTENYNLQKVATVDYELNYYGMRTGSTSIEYHAAMLF